MCPAARRSLASRAVRLLRGLASVRHYWRRVRHGIQSRIRELHERRSARKLLVHHYGHPRPVIAGVRSLRGWENDVFAFTIRRSGQEPPTSQVLRVYTGEVAGTKVEVETCLLEALGQVGFPVPAIEGRGHTSDGRPFLILEQIRGSALRDEFYGVPRGEAPSSLEPFMGLLARLHTVDWQAALPPRRHAIPALDGGGTQRWLALRQELEWGRLSSELEATGQWLVNQVLDIEPEPAVLLHLDYHPGNVLKRAERPDVPVRHELVVIDWTTGAVADPRLDLSGTLLSLERFGGPPLRQAALTAYERHSGRCLPDLEWFEAAVAFDRLVTMALAIDGQADVIGWRPHIGAYLKNLGGPVQFLYDRFRTLTRRRLSDIERILERAAA